MSKLIIKSSYEDSLSVKYYLGKKLICHNKDAQYFPSRWDTVLLNGAQYEIFDVVTDVANLSVRCEVRKQ